MLVKAATERGRFQIFARAGDVLRVPGPWWMTLTFE